MVISHEKASCSLAAENHSLHIFVPSMMKDKQETPGWSFRFLEKSQLFFKSNGLKYIEQQNTGSEICAVQTLRGGGCSPSNIGKINHSQKQFEYDKTKLPNFFLIDISRHLNVICDKAQAAYEEKQKEEILVSIQWLISMREYFNRLCIDTRAASATYDLLFESLPKLLKSAVTYLRISGFLCLQILQISNDIARVLFTFFMTNGSRFMKIQDKEMLEELIIDFETQLDIEAQNIWVAGAEFEITMIKGVVQSSPSNTDEGKKLLISFIGGLVKTVLTMSASEDFINTIIGGAKFLNKAYQSNSLKKKYEIYYYFESLKWYVIQLLKDDVSIYKLIQLLQDGQRSHIENSNDWLLNFCWVKMIASLISYRPIICKSELKLNQKEESQIWNQLIQQKHVCTLSSNKSLGRLTIFQHESNHETSQLTQLLMKLGLNSFKQFSQTLLGNISSKPNDFFSLRDQTQNKNQQRNYLEMLSQPDIDLDELIDSQNKLFSDLEQMVDQVLKDIQKIRWQDVKKRQGKMLEISQNINSMIKLSCKSFHQTIAIRNTIWLHVYKLIIIIQSIQVDDLEDIQNGNQQILNIEKQFEVGDVLIQLFKLQSKILELLVNIEIRFRTIQNPDVFNNQFDFNLKNQMQNLPELFNQFKSIGKQCYSMIGELNKIKKERFIYFKNKIIKYQLINHLEIFHQTIKKIVSQDTIQCKIKVIYKFYQNNSNLVVDPLTKLVFFNTLRYQIFDLIYQMINFKEMLQQMISFFEKNINLILTTQTDTEIHQGNINVMLTKQLQIILHYFSQEEKQLQDNKQSDFITLDQILTILKQDSEYLAIQETSENQNLLSIRQAVVFVEEFLLQYQQSPEKLPFIQDYIKSIYKKLNIKLEEKICQQSFNLRYLNAQNSAKQIELMKNQLELLIQNITSALDLCQQITSKSSDIIILYERIQNIKFKLNLPNECDQQYFQEFEISLIKKLQDQINNLNEFKLDFTDTYTENQIKGQTDLNLILNFIDLYRVNYSELYGISPESQQNVSTMVQNAKDILNDQKYKIQSSTQEQNLVKFCQDHLVQLWGSEKDERVKLLLKNTELLNMQKQLFSSDLKSFSKRLQTEMEKRFEKINDIEQRIHQEGDSQIRQQLQQNLELEHREFEDYLDNIHEMSQKLDIGIQFLKDIKRSVAQLKQKIDKLQDTINVIGDDVRKLRGKSYAELFNIRKRKVLDSKQLRSITQIYIPLKCQEWDPITGKEIGNPSILSHDSFGNQEGEINEFLQNDSKEKDILLLRGIAGSGKSRAAGKIEEFLWQKYEQKESVWFPIYVSLPTIKEPKFNLIDQALESEFYQFDKIQIREFKEALQQQDQKIIFILDSYDEMKQECIQSNLYHTNRMAQDLFGHLDSKMVKNYLKVIITTRTEILTSSTYQTWFYGEKLESLKEVELLGFDQEQKHKYLQEYTILSMKREFLELNNYNQTNQLTDLLNFWKIILDFLSKNPSTKEDNLVNEKQANQICIIVRKEKCYQKLSKDQLVSLEKKLIDLWSVQKFEKLITNAQIQHILTTPFMMEIVVQVLPSMTKKYQDPSGFKEIFIFNYIRIIKQEHTESVLILKNKQKNNQYINQKEIQFEFDKKEAKVQANKLWDQLLNEKYFTKFSLVDKVNQSDLSTIDQANIVVRALIVKQLTVFDFYFTFVEFYHLQQIRKQQELGRSCNLESLLIDLFNFSQSLAIDMMLRQLTQIKYNSKGQLNLKFVKVQNDEQKWQDTYFNDFQANGEYKQLIRSCILLTQKGSNQLFTHKSIQEFFVGHYLLNALEEVQNFEENHFQLFIEQYKWEENQIKMVQFQDQQNLQIQDLQKFCQIVSDSLYNLNEFNLSTDGYKGVITLTQGEIQKQKKLKSKLIQIVKLSAISNQFTRASSNSIYLLGQMNEYLGNNFLQNITLSDTELSGLSFYGSNLEGSVFNNVNINCCNFNKVNLKNARWTNIKCNELHSIIGDKNQLTKLVFSQSGQFIVSCSDYVIYMCNLQEGTQTILIDYKTIMCKQFFGEDFSDKYKVNQMVFSPDESLLAIGWYQALGYEYIAFEYFVIQIWNMKSGQSTYLEKQQFLIQQIIFTPDSQYLIACGQKTLILKWNIKEQKQLACLEGHKGQINCIAYTQDGKILGSCSQDSTIRLWQLSDFSELQILKGHTKCVNYMAFQPNGLTMASCSYDLTIRLWSMVTYENICVFQAHTQLVAKLYFLPDDQTLVSLGNDKLIIIWDVKEQKQLRCIIGSQDDYKYVARSSNGKLLAQQNQSEVQIWDLTVGKIVAIFEGQSKKIIEMAFQPGVQILASIDESDNQIKLWDAQTGKIKNKFNGHLSEVLLIAFSPDSTKLASWGKDATLRIWDIVNGKQIVMLEKIKIRVIQIQFSEDGQYLFIQAFQNLSNYIWHFKDDKLITIDFPQLNTQKVTTQIISQPNGELMVWGVIENNLTPIIKLWNVKEKTMKNLMGHKRSLSSLVFFSDRLISHSDDESVIIWDLKKLEQIAYFNLIYYIYYSNNGDVLILYNTSKRIIIYSVELNKELGQIETTHGQNLLLNQVTIAQAIDKTIQLWNIKDGKQITTLEGHSQNIEGLVFSPNGQILVSFSKETSIKVWSMKDKKVQALLEGHTDEITGIYFSPNGEILASYGKDQTIRLWETKEFTLGAILEGHEEILFLIFSLDNSTLASAYNNCKIILWNIADGHQIQQFENCSKNSYQFSKNSIAFSPDSCLFIFYSATLDRNVIWNVKQNIQHGLLAGHSGNRNVTFSTDSQTLATFIKDESLILLWNVNQCSMEDLINIQGSSRTTTVISQDCKILAVYGNDKIIQIYDPQTGKHLTTLSGHKHMVSSICFSPDGLYLVSCSWDYSIRLWDVKEWKQIQVLEGHKHQIDQIVFSPDGLSFASASKDNSIRLWNMSTYEKIKVIENKKQIINVKQLIFSSDGLKLAWYNVDDSTVYVLTLQNEALKLDGQYDLRNIIGFSQYNQLLFYDKQNLNIWDLKKKEPIARFQFYLSENQVVLSKNGKMMAILKSNADKKACIVWDLEQNREIVTSTEHTNNIVSIAFSPDDSTLASCGSDGMIKLLDVSQKIILCYKTLAIYQPLTAQQCLITGSQIISKIGWNLKQLFMQKGAIE